MTETPHETFSAVPVEQIVEFPFWILGIFLFAVCCFGCVLIVFGILSAVEEYHKN